MREITVIFPQLLVLEHKHENFLVYTVLYFVIIIKLENGAHAILVHSGSLMISFLNYKTEQ